MSEQQITVPQFLQVRTHVANLLKQDSNTQLPTRIRQAENLMAAGAIDVQAVLDKFTQTALEAVDTEIEESL